MLCSQSACLIKRIHQRGKWYCGLNCRVKLLARGWEGEENLKFKWLLQLRMN